MTTFDSRATWDGAGTWDQGIIVTVPILNPATVTDLNYSDVANPTVLSTSVGVHHTVIYPQSMVGYPDPPFLLSLDRGTILAEVVMVTATNGLAATVRRGVDGTALPHAAGASVEHAVTDVDYQGANDHYTTSTEDVHLQYLSAARHNSLDLHTPNFTLAAPDSLPGDFTLGQPSSEGVSLTAAYASHTHATPSYIEAQAAIVPAGVVLLLPEVANPTPPWLTSMSTPVVPETYYFPAIEPTDNFPIAGPYAGGTINTYPQSNAAPAPVGYTNPGPTLDEANAPLVWATTSNTYTNTSTTHTFFYVVFSTPLEDIGVGMGWLYTVGSPDAGSTTTTIYARLTQAEWTATTGYTPQSAAPAGTAYQTFLDPKSMFYYSVVQRVDTFVVAVPNGQTNYSQTPPSLPLNWGVVLFLNYPGYDDTSGSLSIVSTTGPAGIYVPPLETYTTGSVATTITNTPISYSEYISIGGIGANDTYPGYRLTTTTTQNIIPATVTVVDPLASTLAPIFVNPYHESQQFTNGHWGFGTSTSTVDYSWESYPQLFDLRIVGWVA